MRALPPPPGACPALSETCGGRDTMSRFTTNLSVALQQNGQLLYKKVGGGGRRPERNPGAGLGVRGLLGIRRKSPEKMRDDKENGENPGLIVQQICFAKSWFASRGGLIATAGGATWGVGHHQLLYKKPVSCFTRKSKGLVTGEESGRAGVRVS